MARWGYHPKRSEFVYDGRSRLRIRREYQYAGSTWQWVGDTRYVYDGMRVIQERDSNNTPTVSYSRGVDLSGSLEGAGGIGGLLARSHGYSGSTGNWSTHNFYHADGGGNVTYLINAGQSMTAQYRYDPFGRTTYLLGTMATANTYRFSSKEMHPFTGMYYYGYRFYDPLTQRWLYRDPIAELGGINLYAFVLNNPINRLDSFGLITSVDTTIRACLSQPTAALRISCLERLLPDIDYNEGNIKICKNAIARAKAGANRSINQINKTIDRVGAPKSVKRADTGKIKGEQDHLHFRDGSAINRDGTWKHGGRRLTRPEEDFLIDNGFPLPRAL